MTNKSPYGLVLYYSRHGALLQMAQAVAIGMEKNGLEARIRTVPDISPKTEQTEAKVPEAGAPYVTLEDLAHCTTLALGSPGYFGNMASPLKYFWDTTTPLWMQGALIGKPAGVFCATSSWHGGNESTLWNMMAPLFHHGMILVGLSYAEATLSTTQHGGSPYGPTHITGTRHELPLHADERLLCQCLGERLSLIGKKLT